MRMAPQGDVLAVAFAIQSALCRLVCLAALAAAGAQSARAQDAPATDAQRLQRAIREAWNRENRFPLKMAIAIHPAFRHLGLNIFKTPDRATFVTAVRPHAIDPALTTDEVRQILECLHITPGLNRQELVLKLNPGVPADAPGITGMMQALRWLVDKGHVIEFFNGKLAVPARRMSGAPEPKATELPDAQPPPSETPSMPRSDAATSPAKGATDQHQPQGAQGV